MWILPYETSPIVLLQELFTNCNSVQKMFGRFLRGVVKLASMVPKGKAFRVASGTPRPISSLGKLAVPEGTGRMSFTQYL